MKISELMAIGGSLPGVGGLLERHQLERRCPGPAANLPHGGEANRDGGSVSMPELDGAPSTPLLLVDASGLGASDAASSGMTMLSVTIRDFKFWDAGDPITNPDFQNVLGDDHATITAGNAVVGTIAAETLGANRKPVYKSATQTRTTHGKAFFDQWYNDVPGTNVTVSPPLTLSGSVRGTYGYDSLVSGVPLSATDPTKMWFPIDDGSPYQTSFGNQGQPHNYAFTTELHTVFVYRGGETFMFSGDDDVFVFIDGKLVIDLGGVHVREQATVQLDTLGLTLGMQYPLDLFNAERHTVESNMSFTTTLQLQPVAQ